MAFINWGQESKEQKKYRSFLEEQALLEQAINNARSRSGNLPGVGGGSKLNTLTTDQTALVVFKEIDSTNYQYYIANYVNGTITGPFDTGVAKEDYILDDLTTGIIQYGGYSLRFYRGDTNENKIIFMDSHGMVVDTINATSTDVDMTSISGRFIRVTDTDAGLLWIFDGTTVLMDDVSLSGIDNFNFNIGTAYPAGGGFLTLTNGLDSSAHRFYIYNSTSVNMIYESTQTPGNNLTPEFYTYCNTNKVIVKTTDIDSGLVVKLEVLSLTGTIEETILIDQSLYNETTLQFYGSGSWFLHIRNNSDTTVAHRVYNYDGTTNTLDEISVDAETYTDWEYVYRERSLSNSYPYPVVENAAIVFHGNVSGITNGFLEIDQCRIVNFFAGDPISYFDFASASAKKIYLSDIGVNKNFFLYAVDDADTDTISSLVIKAGVAPIVTNLSNPIVDLSDIDIHEVGEKMDMIVEYSSGEPVTFDTYVYTYSANGLKLPGRLELDTESHSYWSSYNTYLVYGDDYDNFINSTTGVWSQYEPALDVISTGIFTQAGQIDVPYLLTEKPGLVPYTHTQLSERNDGELPEIFIMDGAVADGTLYFGQGSSYFTNLYPGLFVLVAKSIDISSFKIDGNVGADGEGSVTTSIIPIAGYSKTYTAYVKSVYDAGDPSINHIIIIDTDGTGVDQIVDLSSEDDLHEITGITGATEIHYLLLAKAEDTAISLLEAQSIITAYLDMVDGDNIATTLSTLNSGYSTITDLFPAYDSGDPDRIYYFSDYGDGVTSTIDDGGDDMYDGANIITTSLTVGTRIKVFNGNGSVNSYTIPEYDGSRLGKSRMLVWNGDNNSADDVVLRHYSIKGNLLNTVITPHLRIDDSTYCEDRALVITSDKVFDGGVFYNTRLYSFSSLGVDYIEVNLPDENRYRIVLNDWGWYNN